MKLSTSAYITIALIVLQAIAQLSSVLPDEWKHIALTAHVLAEAVVKFRVHFTNTDGTPQSEPYTKPQKQQE